MNKETKTFSFIEAAKYVANHGVDSIFVTKAYLLAEDEYFKNLQKNNPNYSDGERLEVDYNEVDSYISSVTGLKIDRIHKIADTITEYMIEEGMIDGYDEETGDYHVVDLLVVD